LAATEQIVTSGFNPQIISSKSAVPIWTIKEGVSLVVKVRIAALWAAMGCLD
jgi:hypothetical protein